MKHRGTLDHILHFRDYAYKNHTSALSGHAWVMELLDGHPDHIKNELEMRKHVFHALIATLRASRLQDSHHLSLNEKVAIFLYMSVTGMHICNVGECF